MASGDRMRIVHLRYRDSCAACSLVVKAKKKKLRTSGSSKGCEILLRKRSQDANFDAVVPDTRENGAH